MWINNTYINEKCVATVEPYIMDCSYGIRVNDIPVEIDRTTERYSPEEKEELLIKIMDNYIKEIEKCNG